MHVCLCVCHSMVRYLESVPRGSNAVTFLVPLRGMRVLLPVCRVRRVDVCEDLSVQVGLWWGGLVV